MILHLRSCRRRLFPNVSTLNFGRKEGLRLRAPSSLPQTSVAVAERRSCLDSSDHATVLASAGREPLVICWHPPKPFPYEHTKPIERSEEELRQGDSPVRHDLTVQFKAMRTRGGFQPRPYHELQNMFYSHSDSFLKDKRQRRIDETCEPRPINRKGL